MTQGTSSALAMTSANKLTKLERLLQSVDQAFWAGRLPLFGMLLKETNVKRTTVVMPETCNENNSSKETMLDKVRLNKICDAKNTPI